jgi:hypothetical protein
MNIKCKNCSMPTYRNCPAPGILQNGKLCCEQEKAESKAVCSQCGASLQIGHFAYNYDWEEFWCESCLRELLYSQN